MPDQEYKPIDYKINKNFESNDQNLKYIQEIAMQQAKTVVAQETKKLMVLMIVLLLVLLYALYAFNQTTTALENNFKKELSEYQKRIDVLEADKKK